MPNIVTGSTYKDAASLAHINYDYDYAGLNLKPGSRLHKKIVDEVMEKARMSHAVMTNRHSSWNDIDRLLTTFVSPTDEDRKIKKHDPNKPVTIVFPYSYAVMETMLTYLSAVFFQDPVFRYEGTSPEDTLGAIMMELVVQKHTQRNKIPLALHTMFRDMLAYGIGPVAPAWEVRTGKRIVQQTQGVFQSTYNRLLGRQPETVYEESVLFEGNVLHNIDPYCVLPDPSVSAHRIQDGEFFGWVESTNLPCVLGREKVDQNYFNVQYLQHLADRRVTFSIDPSARSAKHGIDKNAMYGQTKPCDIVHMFINLLPAEWGLGNSPYPEKWLFSIAAGEVVVQARPLNLNHGMYPIAVAAPDYDGYSISPISKLETQYGLQHTLNWFFNSHVTNVRKAMNDMFVVDPYMINMKDMQTPEPGKLIRMRRPAWGRGVRDAVMQLNVHDVTQQHMQNAAWIINWMNNLVGTDESMMGSMRQGGPERLTKAEFLGTRQGSFSRLEHMAKLVSMQAMQDLAFFFASHTQQLMSQDTYVKTVGEWEGVLKKEYGIDVQKSRMKVSPKDLLIDYDVCYLDGSLPSTDSADLWFKMFSTIAEHPELNQRFDITRIFGRIARSAGEKNVQEFYRIMPDEQVMQQVQQGNLVPEGGGNIARM